jgi:deoxycytidine triphosphate deaminase
MILSASSIRGLLSGARAPISPTPDPSRLDFIEGGAYDLTLHLVQMVKSKRYFEYRFRTNYDTNKGGVFIGKDERIIPEADDVPWVTDDKGRYVVNLEVGRSYLLQSLETITLPPGVQCLVLPKTSFFRGGGVIQGTSIPFGFSGQITVGFSIPVYSTYFTLEKECRFATLLFFRVDSVMSKDLDPYEGVWGGDKTTTDGLSERPF